MKVFSLLILWSLPFLQAGGNAQSPCSLCSSPSHAEAHGNSAMIQNADDRSFPDDPGGGSLGSSLWDEDDSVEDGFFDTGLLPSGSLRNHELTDLASVVRAHHDLLRIPARPHPLRC